MIVYISGPYTDGDVAENVHEAIWAGISVLDYGHTPIVPHLSHFMHIIAPRRWERWIGMDMDLLRTADAVIHLPGPSKGAKLEVAEAKRLGIPVYEGVAEWLKR